MSKIYPYYGEFLISPVPLELSLNYCSHKCSYCFANLNKPDRSADIRTIMNQILNCRKNTSFESQLLANKAAVLISNRVDPFSESNYKLSLPIIDLLSSNGNPVVFQTKGGKGVSEALDTMKYKTLWYVSVSYWDDEIRKKIEPAAPSIQSRLELIQELKRRGHAVIAGINPLTKDWCNEKDFDLLTDWLKNNGVKDIWTEALHFNSMQIASMTDRERSNYSPQLLAESKSNKITSLTNHLLDSIDRAKEKGFKVFSIGAGSLDPVFQETHELLGHSLFKTVSDFVFEMTNELEGDETILFTGEEMLEYFYHPFFSIPSSQHRGYLMVRDRGYVRTGNKKPFVPKTLKGILKVLIERDKLECFSPIIKVDDLENVYYLG